ncbi:hypothetical protein M427DRAFT_33822 [Gonapodya prolifera JEL478]|uniref:BHLH domain-containing protein n=1 Tax=Gonapodya prolifera (strain JEL478) TaxID=1344416 RepID=A0A139AAG2_GONPJ|nr:hypothetical protein M427DRAFT_33822 [Gonapodya prolifera JEL478]|eukprot:KXS13644.1 hypothetical protein M427DRAFT_33822 [Gonapodya prolifera JEL478]
MSRSPAVHPVGVLTSPMLAANINGQISPVQVFQVNNGTNDSTLFALQLSAPVLDTYSEQRRVVHKEAEQRRRNDLKKLIQDLRVLVPDVLQQTEASGVSGQSSRLFVLQKTYEYVLQLQDTDRANQKRIEELKARIDVLRAQRARERGCATAAGASPRFAQPFSHPAPHDTAMPQRAPPAAPPRLPPPASDAATAPSSVVANQLDLDAPIYLLDAADSAAESAANAQGFSPPAHPHPPSVSLPHVPPPPIRRLGTSDRVVPQTRTPQPYNFISLSNVSAADSLAADQVAGPGGGMDFSNWISFDGDGDPGVGVSGQGQGQGLGGLRSSALHESHFETSGRGGSLESTDIGLDESGQWSDDDGEGRRTFRR